MDDLLTKLLIHEIHFKEDEEEVQTKKELAFKTTSEGLYSSKDESNEGDENSMAMIARRGRKIFKSNRFNPRKLYKAGSS